MFGVFRTRQSVGEYSVIAVSERHIGADSQGR